MTHPREVLVLDLDGTILEGRDRHYACYSRILSSRGYRPIDLETYWQLKRERENRRDLLARSGAESIYEEFIGEWLGTIESDDFLRLDRLYDGVAEWLSAAASVHDLVLATMRQRVDALHEQLRRLGLERLFTQISVSRHEEEGEGKAAMVRALRPAIWIGDTEADVRAARIVGAKSVAVTSGVRTAEYLASLGPDLIAAGLTSIQLSDLVN